MSYVDGYVLAVPAANKAQYQELAAEMAQMFIDHGAISVVENWGDDVPDGKVTSMPMAVQCKSDEVVVFSWITWASKEARDAGNQAVEQDPRMATYDPADFPFDGQRMIFGGFETMVRR